MIDSHTHLSDEKFNIDRYEIIEKCLTNNINVFVEILCSSKEWEFKKLFNNYRNNFFFACGIHPHYTAELSDETIRKLELELKEENVIAIGEIGLDYWWDSERKKEQFELLKTQLSISDKIQKPVIFHLRNSKNGDNAYRDFFDFIKENWKFNRKIRGIIHSFSGDTEDAKNAVDSGLLIGINATVTYPRNQKLRDVIKLVGIENILTETDCPYLPPQSMRGKRNTPLSIIEIINQTSEVVGLEQNIIKEKIDDNFKKFIS